MDLKFWFAVLASLPELIAFFRRLADRALSARDKADGYNEAVKDAIRESTQGLVIGMEAVMEAREKHKADPTDDAFDKTFMRND